MRITNVYADFPGSVHDQFILGTSAVKTEMDRLHANNIGQFYLLGDSGYSLQPYMLTPVLNAPENTHGYRYTQNHCFVRNTIERVFGVLKCKWRCLRKDRVLHYKPKQAATIIKTCAILHNIAMNKYV